MPREHLLREVGKHRNAFGYSEIIGLKRLYRVSGAALLMRLRQLDVISESTLIYAFQTIARGWRTQEPRELEDAGNSRKARTGSPLRQAVLSRTSRRHDFISARPPSFCSSLCRRSRPV